MFDSSDYKIGLLDAMNSKLKKNEGVYRLLVEKSGNAYGYYSFADRRIECFCNWEKFFGFSGHDYKSVEQITSQVEESYADALRECLLLERRKKTFETVEFKFAKRNVWLSATADVIYDDNGDPVEKLICFRDITKYKIINDELSYMAYYDAMTGLYNRNYFVRELNRMISEASESRSVVSLLFIDIDDFRRINDGMGIIVGDEIVQRFGEVLRDVAGEFVKCAHFSGDIYCVAIYDPCGSRSVEEIVRSIKQRIAQPIRLSNGIEITITISIGVAEYPEATMDAMELINLAEIMTFKAKHRGKGLIQYFDQPTIQEFRDNVEIEQKMDKAMKNENFFMCYQPQFDTNTKELRGIEALVRWRDDDGSIISPGKFIPIAEKNGAILPLGEYVIDKSLSDYSKLMQKYGDRKLILSINISALQFKSANFINFLVEKIKEYEIPANKLELEITESALIDDMQDVINKMNILREMGIRFSMDDFGTGFSSLSYLRQLPIDTLKIDKSFIDSVVTDGPTRTIAETIIELSKKMGFDTIAEGVEEEVQYSLLKNIGCENIQGFYFGKPMKVEDIDALYKESK